VLRSSFTSVLSMEGMTVVLLMAMPDIKQLAHMADRLPLANIRPKTPPM
jgi:hypothetical protein